MLYRNPWVNNGRATVDDSGKIINRKDKICD